MLRLTIRFPEMWDEINEEFRYRAPVELQLEHSLVSVAKWESKWHKPFLGSGDRTAEETLDYIRCMTITKNVDPSVYDYMDQTFIQRVSEYIDDPMTATWFTNRRTGPPSSEQVTAELIYYWMIAFEIPFECQKWHLNRLLTLIRVCEAKTAKSEKMSRNDVLRQQNALNAARRKKYNTRG